MGVKGLRTKGILRDRTRLYTKSTYTQWLIDIVIPNSMCWLQWRAGCVVGIPIDSRHDIRCVSADVAQHVV